MQWISRLFDKTGAVGTLVAAMSCPLCFPALGSLAAALGIGFLAQYEGLFINTLLPVFAVLVLLANTVSFISHKKKLRLLAGVAGPVMVLLTLYPLWAYSWSTYLFYVGLLMMVGAALWDIIRPPQKTCHSTSSITGKPVENNIILESKITCPECGHMELEVMPTDACQWFYDCKNCGAVLKPKQGDCCVFCSYGTVPCPPIQQGTNSCCSL